MASSYKAPFLFGLSGYGLMSFQDWRRRKEFLVDFSPGPAAECHWSSRGNGPGGSLAAFGNASRTAALQQPTRRDDARWRDETKNVKARSKKSKIEFASCLRFGDILGLESLKSQGFQALIDTVFPGGTACLLKLSGPQGAAAICERLPEPWFF